MIQPETGSPPRVALIGAGNICRTAHLPLLLRLGATIECAVDPSQSALAALAEQVPKSVRLIRSKDLELPASVTCAIVCSPAGLHSAQVKTLLKQRIHVLCEKPLALSARDALMLTQLAETNRLVLQVGYYRRFHPAAKMVRSLVASGELGLPLRCTVRAGHSMTDGPPSMFDRRLGGGGVLVDFGVHVLDRLVAWFGHLQLCDYADDNDGGVEANALLRLHATMHGRNLPIEIALSRTHNLDYFARIEFERGTVVCHFNQSESLRVSQSADHTAASAAAASQPLVFAETRNYLSYFAAQWREFISRIEGGGQVESSLADAVHVTELMEQCYHSKKIFCPPGGW